MADRSFDIARLPGFATIAVTIFVLLYLPIATLVAYSFNGGDSVAVWGGFSLDWYRLACSLPAELMVKLELVIVVLRCAAILADEAALSWRRYFPANDGTGSHLDHVVFGTAVLLDWGRHLLCLGGLRNA